MTWSDLEEEAEEEEVRGLEEMEEEEGNLTRASLCSWVFTQVRREAQRTFLRRLTLCCLSDLDDDVIVVVVVVVGARRS